MVFEDKLQEFDWIMFKRYCEDVRNSILIEMLDEDAKLEFLTEFINRYSRDEAISDGWSTDEELTELGL